MFGFASAPFRGKRAPRLAAMAAILLTLVLAFPASAAGESDLKFATPRSPLPPLAITFAAATSAEVEFLISSVRPYIERGDSFDIVSGSPENLSRGASVGTIDGWAQQLHAAKRQTAHGPQLLLELTRQAGIKAKVAGVVRPGCQFVHHHFTPG